MSYPIQPPPVAAPSQPAGRPPTVTAASALLWAMAAAGLIYAIVTLAVMPGVVSRFRDATVGGADPETYITVLWLGAAIAMVFAVILVALYAVLGIALRRGSNGARVAILVVCVLGALGGAVAALTVGAERGGSATAGSLGERLTDAYPGGWVGTNVGLAVAQIFAYVVVAALVLTAPKAFFGRGAAAPQAGPPSAYGFGGYPPAYPGAYPGSQSGYASPSGYPVAPGQAPPGYAPPPGYGPSSGYASQPGYGPPSGYAPQPGYGPQSGYASQPGYGPPSGYAPQPGQAAQPDQAYQAGQAAQPGQMAQSGEIAQPGQGAQPGQVGQAGQVAQPGRVAQPGEVPPAAYGPAGYYGAPAGSGPVADTGVNPPAWPPSTPPSGPQQPGSDEEYWSRPSD